MVAAIEVYNKPDFLYREETFAVLAVNGWELLLKAKWLADNANKVQSLYVYESATRKDGSKGKRQRVKLTRSKNPFTHSIDYIAKRLVDSGELHKRAWESIQALLEIRDTAIHFYNHGGVLSVRVQEVGTASLRNFVAVTSDWFNRDLSEFNFYLMPLSFMAQPGRTDALVLNAEEKNLLRYIEELDALGRSDDARFCVVVNLEVKLTRSGSNDAPAFRITNDPNAREIRLTEEQIREKYPWDYQQLTEACRRRYVDFKQDGAFHATLKRCREESRYGTKRLLNPASPKSPRVYFYNPNPA